MTYEKTPTTPLATPPEHQAVAVREVHETAKAAEYYQTPTAAKAAGQAAVQCALMWRQ